MRALVLALGLPLAVVAQAQIGQPQTVPLQPQLAPPPQRISPAPEVIAPPQQKEPPPGLAPAPTYRGVYATIDIAPAQEIMKRLAARSGGTRWPAIREVLKAPEAQIPPVLYALANALADDNTEQGVFWFHVARIRAVYDGLRCRDVTSRHAVSLLGKQMHAELRRAQFYQRGNLVNIAQRAIDWDAKHPRNYDHRWIALFGEVAGKSPGTDPNEITVPESEWPALLKRTHDAHLKSVAAFAAQKPPAN